MIPLGESNTNIKIKIRKAYFDFCFLSRAEINFEPSRKQKTHNVSCGFPFAEKEAFEPNITYLPQYH